MDVQIESSWKQRLFAEFEADYFKELSAFVRSEYARRVVYPRGSQIFRAFDQCPFDKVKVVIIGQDPYHGTGQANGLCFSVNEGVKHPPSLRNIFKEIEMDIGKKAPVSGDLDRWAKQGVLMLNATLTVREADAGSHQRKGWETFTDAVIQQLNEARLGIVYMLWGSYAQKKGYVIDREKNKVLIAPHPSPLSAHRGFFGCGHFSAANSYLKGQEMREVEW